MRCGHSQTSLRNVSSLRAPAQGVVAGQPACAIAKRQTCQSHGLAGADVLAGHRAGAAQSQCFATQHIAQREDARCHIRRAVVAARAAQIDGALADGAGRVVSVSHRIVVAAVAVVQGDAGYGHGLVARARICVSEGEGAAGKRIASEQRAAGHRRCARCRGVAVVGLAHIAARERQVGSSGIHRLRAAGEGVIAGKAAVTAINQGQCSERDRFAGADVLARHCACAAQAQRFTAHQRPQRQHAGGDVRRAVVAARAAQAHRKRINRAGRIVGIGDVVVSGDISTAAVTDDQAAGAYCLVTVADVLVGEGQRGYRDDRLASAGQCANGR